MARTLLYRCGTAEPIEVKPVYVILLADVAIVTVKTVPLGTVDPTINASSEVISDV